MTKTPGLLGTQMLPRDVIALLYLHGWKEPVHLVQMGATVQGESSRFTGAIGKVNSNGSQDWGLFQINNFHWADFAPSEDAFFEMCIDPARAAVIARKLWDKDQKAGGSGFGPWFAFGGQGYLDALPTFARGLANFTCVQLGIPLVV